MNIKENILDTIGETPLVRLNRIAAHVAPTICAKLERFNPMGSVKDRPALAMINRAEKEGRLGPDSVIVEPTSGNTGLGLAMVAAVRGYRVKLIMEEIDTLDSVVGAAKALGAEIIPTESFNKAVELAEQMQRDDPNVFVPQQFKNLSNPKFHEVTTAPEIIRDAGPGLRAFVASFGSGGSITGIGRALKRHDPSIEIVLVEPDTVPIFSGGRVTCSEIHGVGPAFKPDIVDESVIDTIVQANARESQHLMRKLALEEGMICGPSSGAILSGAFQISERYGEEDIIVVIFPDMGDRYLCDGVFEEPDVNDQSETDE